MTKMFCSPSKYIQAPGLFGEIGKYLVKLGTRPMVIVDSFVFPSIAEALKKAFEDAGMEYDIYQFQGECCSTTIEKIKEKVLENGDDIVIGIGGGKTLDTAKSVSYYTKHPVVIAPTAASTDAPCSSLSVLYTEEGVFDRYLFLDASPNVILVDSEVIAKAPVRLFVAGMGDALATYFEARAVQRSGKKNQVHEHPTIAGFTLAETCYKMLMADGLSAKQAIEAHCCTKAVENIIETNTYLSGVGFESGGLGAAHAVQKGLTVIEELHPILHGEKVAFCTLVQLVLENAPAEEVNSVLQFNKAVGLPVCFADMGLETIEPERVRAIAEKTCVEGSTIYNMPFEITVDSVCNAIIAADCIGRNF